MSLVVLRNLNDDTRNNIKQIEEWYLPKDAVKTNLTDSVGRPLYIWSNNTTKINATATVASVQIAASVAVLSQPGSTHSVWGNFFKAEKPNIKEPVKVEESVKIEESVKVGEPQQWYKKKKWHDPEIIEIEETITDNV